MANRDDYEEKLEAIRSIEDSRIETRRRLPMDAFLQEADALYYWSRDDIDVLSAAGLPPERVTDLPVRCGALREAEQLWVVQKNTGKEATRQWAEESPLAHELRQEMITQFRFAFRKHPQLMKLMKHISPRDSNASMVQGLNDLSVAGKENKPLLEAIGFDMSLLDKAAEMSKAMGQLLARSEGAKKEYNAAKKIRDQAYTYLKEAVDEIREYGRFVFRKQKDRRIGYRSNYIRKLNMRAQAKSKAKSTANPPEPGESGEERQQ